MSDANDLEFKSERDMWRALKDPTYLTRKEALDEISRLCEERKKLDAAKAEKQMHRLKHILDGIDK